MPRSGPRWKEPPLNPAMQHVDVEPEALREAVRVAVGCPEAEVVEWACERLEGGVMSDVFRLTGTWRARAGEIEQPWSLVLKLIEECPHSDDPEGAAREAYVYGSGLLEAIAAGIRAPRLYLADQPSPAVRRLWLQYVPGRCGSALSEGDYLVVAHALGVFQAAAAEQPCAYHRTALTQRHHVPELGERWHRTREREADARPDLATRIPPEHHQRLGGLREAGAGLAASWSDLPLTLCHRTAFPGNCLVADEPVGPRVTLIDWDQAGVGCIGEDPSDVILGALLDGDVALASAERLVREVLEAYASGLAEGGLACGGETVRRAFVLCAALHWFPRVAAVAQRARDDRELSHYRALLDFLAPFADEALATA